MTARLRYLDSLRGIGAAVVACGHFAVLYMNFVTLAPFATAALFHDAALIPVVLAVDCDTAVCLFYVLSGFVLTRAFAPYLGAAVATLAGRFVRLFLPGFCACLFGFLVFQAACRLAPGAALAGPGGWAMVLKDLFVSLPLLGYQGQSVLEGLPLVGPFVAAQSSAANPPLWSLSVEWQGSLLIYALVALRNGRRRLWGAAVAALCVICVRDWFICFLFGHLAASFTAPERPRVPSWARRVLALCCLLAGLLMCLLAAADLTGPFGPLMGARFPLPSCNDPTDAERLYAAMLIFAGVCGLTALHRGLEGKLFCRLGRMSFPIYLTHYPILLWGIPVLLRHLPGWFWVADQRLAGISAQLEYPRAVAAAFAAAAAMTLAAASGFLAIDGFAIAAGRGLRTWFKKDAGC